MQISGLSYQLSQKDEEIHELQRRFKSQTDQIAQEEDEKLDLQEDLKAKSDR